MRHEKSQHYTQQCNEDNDIAITRNAMLLISVCPVGS